MPLRVVFVTPWGDRLGGAEEMLWLTLLHCDRTRLEPTVVFLGEGEFEQEVANLGIATEVIPSGRLRSPIASLSTTRKLAALLRRGRPNLLLNWSAKAQLYGSSAASIAGMGDRVVWWQHQLPEGQWVDRLATRLPARAVGCSSTACQAAQASLVPQRHSFVVHPGIEVSREENRDRGQLKRSLGIPAGRLVVGIVGRLQPWKGQDRFLAAIADLRARGHDVHGLIVGGDAFKLSPDYAVELEQLVSRFGLSEFVTMTGQVPDSSSYFGLMDVAVNASEGEPFGIVLLEAMAAGAPVVAVGCGGPLDIVDPGVTGMLADSGEPGPLADAIDVLLANPGRREEMASAARRVCGERFTAKLMSENLTEKLVEIANA